MGSQLTVENGKDDVEFPPNICDSGWRDLDDHVVYDPIAGCGDGGPALAEAEGQDLGSGSLSVIRKRRYGRCAYG